MHYGVKGMKWGVRRYRNEDRSLTREGLRKYGVENTRVLKKGTEIQNISKTKLDSKSKKSNRIYGSYTDAYGASGTQDPLIIFNMEKLGKTNSIKLTEYDLQRASDYAFSKEHNKKT